MIDTQELDRVFRDSLFKDEEVEHVSAVMVEGVMHTFGFHPQRLESHRKEVRAWLEQLPIQFRKDVGGGWSFLNLPFLEGPEPLEQWQWGEQPNAEQLICLGMGLGLAKCQLPRDLWSALPGGMPYYELTLEEGFDVEVLNPQPNDPSDAQIDAEREEV